MGQRRYTKFRTLPALVINLTVLALDGRFGAEFFQHVIHAGQCQLGVLCLLLFAVGVEAFAEVGESGFVFWLVVEVGEGKLIKAIGMIVIQIITHTHSDANFFCP